MTAGKGPGRHPLPPARFDRLDLPVLNTRRSWYRSHRSVVSALHFGDSGDFRFDAPDHQYGVCYAGENRACAFVETFTSRTHTCEVSETELALRSVSKITPRSSLKLLQLFGPGLSRIGADSRLPSGSYELSQQWALAIHRHPARLDGIIYHSRHDDTLLCVAMFDRCAAKLSESMIGCWTDAANLATLRDIVDTYSVTLLP
jgi:hypothetical protein